MENELITIRYENDVRVRKTVFKYIPYVTEKEALEFNEWRG